MHSTDTAHSLFKLSEWKTRETFVGHIETACRRQQVTVDWLSDYWICRLTKNGRVTHISSLLFPLNNAASAGIARDKVATYHVLKDAQIPTIPHWLIRFPPQQTVEATIQATLSNAQLPLVLKPCDRGGGADVYKATTPKELQAILETMSSHYRTIAASPFEDIIDEYRIVLLNQQPQLLFRKVRPPGGGEWRHNLQFGALPSEVADGRLKSELIKLAQATLTAIQLHFAAVDIVTTTEGLKVMEVNAAFSLSKLALFEAFEPLVQRTYDNAVQACFASQPSESAE
ncbi:MAG: hypothetical protein JWN01_252 [Patescibacteria group bacterium]|nr:hypothetical protein [Patescibacteria group bacterium]